jgi:hypothetical protein
MRRPTGEWAGAQACAWCSPGLIKLTGVDGLLRYGRSYHVLEKHFRPEYLAAQERFWRNVKNLHSPPLETWRPRVNGVQLKVSKDCLFSTS